MNGSCYLLCGFGIKPYKVYIQGGCKSLYENDIMYTTPWARIAMQNESAKGATTPIAARA